MKRLFKNKRAFTLIELLIVIAIIGILFVVLISRVDFATDKAKATGVQTDFRAYQMAFEIVSKEYGGFASLGWDKGDSNGDRIRNSVDEGDTNADGIYDADEVWTGRKRYIEFWSGVYTLDNPYDASDKSAYFALQNAINSNLDPKLHITIDPALLTISMANSAKDPWGNEYKGYYLTNAAVDGLDRGAIVLYSAGANNEVGLKQSIASGVVSITNPGKSIIGKDDYGMVTIYTLKDGYGATLTATIGFSNNMNPNDILTPNVPATPQVDYYLVGWINGANYGCEEDYENMGQYRFVNNRLVVTFDQDSYVFIKTSNNANWYMCHAYATAPSATFYNTSSGAYEKLRVPGGTEVTFTLTANTADDTVQLMVNYTIPNATYTVAGNDAFCGTHWDETNTANDMTYNPLTGLYEKTYNNVTAGNHEIKICQNHDWAVSYGNGSDNYYIRVNTAGSTVTITFNPHDNTINAIVTEPEVTEEVYTIAGSDMLCGSDWDPGDTANDMTYNTTTGLYEKIYEGVSAGNYEFKVCKNRGWTVAYPTVNYPVRVNTHGSTVKILFNADTGEITASVVVPPLEGATFTVAGNALLCTSDWNPSDSANDMTFDTNTGLYVKVFDNVPAGNHAFKITQNYSWGQSYGSNGNNVEFFIGRNNATVTITFDYTNSDIQVYVEETNEPFVLTKLYLTPGLWDVDGARFAAYFFGDSGFVWVDVTSIGNGVYECDVPDGSWSNVIFCRMNGASSVNDWGNKWNQTGNLDLPVNDFTYFHVTNWGDGEWRSR